MFVLVCVDTYPVSVLMHVLDDKDTKLEEQGILGRDFQYFTKVLMDFSNCGITVTISDVKQLEIPIQSHPTDLQAVRTKDEAMRTSEFLLLANGLILA